MAWVMNQDKIAVVDVSSLSIELLDIVNANNPDEKKKTKAYRVWGQSADHDYLMGTYKELESAQMVLDMFIDFINTGKKKIFIMPKDETCVVSLGADA